jgi:hypothetical protein
MNSRGIHPLLAGVLGFAALALLLPSFALAVRPADSAGSLVRSSFGIGSVRPDDRSGPLGVGIVATTASATHQVVRPDDRSGPLGVGVVATTSSATHQVARPDDRSGPLGATPITAASRTVSVSLPTSVSSNSFQWSDAAMGAAGTMILCLLVLGAVVLQRQHRGSAVAH